MNITIKGMTELQNLLKAMPGNSKSAVHDELVNITQDLKGKSQNLAPIETGDLRGSAVAEVQGLDGTVSYPLPYSTRQHESMEFRHPKGGQSKFLEQPYKENKDKYVDAIKNAVKKVVDKKA